MVSTFTVNKRIEQPGHNDYIDSWDVPVNADWALIDKAFGGSISVNLTGAGGNVVLSAAQYQPLKIVATGAPVAATSLIVPAGVGGLWVIRNDTTGGFPIGFGSAAGGSGVLIPAGTNTLVTCDGSATGAFYAINTLGPAAGNNLEIQFNNNGILGANSALTWEGGTTLVASNLQIRANVSLGFAGPGSLLTITGTAVAAPNGLQFNISGGAPQLWLGSTANQVGVVSTTLTPGHALTVGGTVHVKAGGYRFPDDTVQTTAARIPAGIIAPFAGPTGLIPTGWLYCDGNNYAQASFPGLYAAIGQSWGSGTGPNQFNVPDLRGRVIGGVDGGTNRLTNAAAGFGTDPIFTAVGGTQSESAGVNIPSTSVGVGNFAAGGLFSAGGTTTGAQSINFTTDGASVLQNAARLDSTGQFTGEHTHSWTGNTGGEALTLNVTSLGASGSTAATTSSTAAATNVQPTALMHWIIKT